MNNKKASQGMTLIEVLIVMAIIGIISGLTLPNQLFYQKYRLKIYAKQLCNDLRYVRYWNINYEEPCSLSLTPSYYRISKKNRHYKKVSLPAYYELWYDQKKATIQFTVDGAPKTGGLSITMVDTKIKQSMVITIIPASGKVSLKDEFKKTP
ncbi:MAG: type II secretion system protein [Epulopiscium sp.]|nr:type II secretion system protein [Candidatus Epulonipiscium sp.]